MRCKIIPTIFSVKKENFLDRFGRMIKVSKELQIDFMDGIFVKSHFMEFNLIPNLKKYTKHKFEAHLMVKKPEKYLNILKNKGFSKIIFHYESYHNKKKIINFVSKIRKLKMKAFLAVNPETNTHDVLLLSKEVDGILFMGVHPGKEHQMFIYDILEHIRQLRHFNKKINIQIDGGVNSSNISYIKRAGANLFNSGSFVSENAKPKEAILKLKKEIKN